ncbi:VIT1/CCC1 transporter family protein [Halomonas sp. PA16-9]|uniref:VIT1/CCC1 transporter family protein n=1 Tax=Halomonas sp. PA16-9 TaxID=2576841 RepID=UPI0030EF964C
MFIIFSSLIGAVAARAGGTPTLKAALRVMFWGALAMAITSGIGRVFGVVA